MLQFYFLSVVANFIAGLTLSSEWFSKKFPGLTSFTSAITRGRGKMIIGLAALLVGFGTLFVPAEPPLVLGDLFPSVMGLAMGVALLFEVFKQDAILPAERSEKAEKLERAPVGYRTTLGVLGIIAAILHFFMPERPFL
jgi:fermentation-respiration switch protein FrsA (DUF1100 family)